MSADSHIIPSQAEETTLAAEPAPPHVSLDEAIRILEALLFASDAPLPKAFITSHVGDQLVPAIDALGEKYAASGVTFMELANGYALRTAPDLDYLFEAHASEPKKLSRAALETLAIIAYHQPVTRAEIEDIRGVSASKGTLDVLLETGWVRMRGRRRTPGRPVTYGTTADFLDQFTLGSLGDLPGLDELKGAGLLDAIPEGALSGPLAGMPNADSDQLSPDEDPLDDEDAQAERDAMAFWPQDEFGSAPDPDTPDEPAKDG